MKFFFAKMNINFASKTNKDDATMTQGQNFWKMDDFCRRSANKEVIQKNFIKNNILKFF